MIFSLTEFWVGATDLETQSVFRWPDGNVISFDKWVDTFGHDQPNGHHDENCLFVSKSVGGGGFQDKICDHADLGQQFGFLCSDNNGEHIFRKDN